MAAIAIFANMLLGYTSKAFGRERALLMVMPIILSVAFFMIADIDSPLWGLVRIPPENLQSLAASLHASLASPEGLLASSARLGNPSGPRSKTHSSMIRTRTDPASALLQAALDQALSSLSRRGKVDARVHGARKALKRARAALRLIRPTLKRSAYQRENRALRDAGRELSPVRDAKALINAIKSFGGSRDLVRASGPALASLRGELEQRLDRARRQFADATTRRACATMIRSSRERLRRAAPVQADATMLRAGLLGIYRGARKWFAHASTRRTAKALHEWRKRTKYLQASAGALRGGRKSSLRKLVEQCGEIAAWLGDDHDLATLRNEIAHAGMSRSDTASVLAGIDQQRQQPQSRALACGAQVFGARPREFIASLAPRMGLGANR